MGVMDDLLNPSEQERARIADMQARGRGPRHPDGLRGRIGFAQGGVGRDGAAGRFGLLDGASAGGGFGSLFTGAGGVGRWIDPQGRVNIGANAEVAAMRMGLQPTATRPWGLEAGLFTAQAGSTRNRSTAAIGAQANLVEATATGAGRLWGDDQSVRVGGSVGGGMSGRLHYGDDDGDGVPEMGFGFDYGPLSFDLRSETIGRGYQWLRRQLGGGSAAGRAIGGGAR
jgi:hypothetical protein